MSLYPNQRSTHAYHPIANSESDDELDSKPSLQAPLTQGRKRVLRLAWLLCVLTIFLVTGSIYSTLLVIHRKTSISAQDQSLSCQNPTVRREWRTLSTAERHDYLAAVQCLQENPSRLGLNHTLYDDFPWVHSRMGNFSHYTPAFIAWHRMFLDIYERTLQENCGYDGHLAYWDWSLDWQDMAKSPIWDGETGFGGNGDKNGEKSVAYGHCVTDGPFANLTVQYFGTEYGAHCLSRGFIHGDRLDRVFGSKVRPEALEAVLLEPDYESFNLKLEEGPHNAIPRAIRGDFFRVTAPNDPVFFLHHTQLDRMWWMWQQRDTRQRLWQYTSKPADNLTEGLLLEDKFHFHGFAPDRKVSEVMSTESELLCYRY